MKTGYDIVVVGAGPSGSVAARRAAEAGLDVLLVEKRQEIGVPIRCAEAVGTENLRSYIEPDPKWIDASIKSFSLTNSKGVAALLPPAEQTLVVNRKVMDFELARLAAAAGAEVRTSTTATGLIMDGGRVCGVRLVFMGVEKIVTSSLVVAADGVESQTARWAGMYSVPPLADFYTAVEYLVTGPPGWINPGVCEYHLDHGLAPGGYLWVFPKGNHLANVGLASPASLLPKGGAVTMLERFLARRCPSYSILAVVTGGIPVTGALKKLVTDGLVVVGDAAHQADPLTGGGINLGMAGADLAMQVAIPAVKSGDTGARNLAAYEELWQKRFGRMFTALYKIRKLFERMSQERLDSLILNASKLPLETMGLGEILLNLLKKDPLLLLEARTLISTGLVTK